MVKRDSTEASKFNIYSLSNILFHLRFFKFFILDVIGLTYMNPIEKLSSRSTDEGDGRSRSHSDFSNISSPFGAQNNKERFEILAINEFDSRR